MKNLNDDAAGLVCREVPVELDVRILAAAKVAAKKRRRLRLMKPWGWSILAAAAGAVFAAGLFLHPTVERRPAAAAIRRTSNMVSESELLALNDWSEFEQNGYILMKNVGSCSQDLADWSSELTWEI